MSKDSDPCWALRYSPRSGEEWVVGSEDYKDGMYTVDVIIQTSWFAEPDFKCFTKQLSQQELIDLITKNPE